MRKLVLLIPLSFICFSVLAQQNTAQPTGTAGQDNLNHLGSDNVNGVVRIFDGRYEGVKGTPYFLSSWGKATLNLRNSYTYDNVELKYNVYENNFLYRKTDGTEMILNPQYVSDFVLRDSLGIKAYEFIRLKDVKPDDPKLKESFFVKLYEGDRVLMVMLPQKKLIKPDYKNAYSPGRNYEELADDWSYYFIDKNNGMQKVSLTRRNLFKMLSDKQSEMQSYLSKEKVDATSEAGWVKALAYYETL